MDWRDLLTAFALYLVLEGIMPFVNPPGFRKFMEMMGQMPDRQIRQVGAFSMLAGLVLLYFVR
ncbi:MAG: DUF2065 domain-containing protein [Pseudomonadota bacterium]|nr:DUF2065 domain-containing protein [Pseudomonadota bacterium]